MFNRRNFITIIIATIALATLSLTAAGSSAAGLSFIESIQAFLGISTAPAAIAPGRSAAPEGDVLLPLSPSAVCTWTGVGGDGLWATATNWSGCTGGGAPATTDAVLLDNSTVVGSYTVTLPTGAVTTSITSLTITPAGANNITLTLPSGNTAVPGLSAGDATVATDDIILNNGAILKNSSGGASGNGIEANSTANGTVRINNGGKYIHNSARSTAGVVPLLSSVAGTETGIFEYDSPGTGNVSLSVSGRTYGSLTLTRTAGAATYTASGSGALTVKGNLTLNSGVTLSSTMTNALNLGGNLTNNGAALSLPAGQTLNLNGTSAQSINGPSALSFVNLSDANTTAAVTFNTNFNVSGTFTMNGAGTLFTPGSPTVQINSAGNAGTITGTGRVQVTNMSGNPFSTQYRFATFSVTALTVEWAGAGNQSIENGVPGYGGIMTSGSGTKTIGGSGTLAVNGNVTIGTGTILNQGANNLNVSGNWSNGGSFISGTSSVAFNGPTGQTITGNTSFYNLTKSVAAVQQMNFTAGSTTTVTNSLTFNGAASNLLTLRSTTPGTQWNLVAPATQSVGYVDVQDSNANGGTLVTQTNSVDSGNNLNWNFGHSITASSGANGSVTPSGVTTVSYNGSQSYTIAPDTGYNVLDVLVDGGSVGAVTSYNFTSVIANHTINASFADLTAPETTMDGPNPANPSNSSSATFTFSGTDAGSGVASIECSIDGSVYASCTSPKTYTGLADGSHTFNVRANDNASNTDASPATYTWSIDTVVPVITAYTPLGNTTPSTAQNLTIAASDDVAVASITVYYSVNGVAQTPITCVLTGANNCTIPGLGTGSAVAYYVRATDTAGNTTDSPGAAAPNLYTVGAAAVPVGTYSNISLAGGSSLSGDVLVGGVLDLAGVVTGGAFTLTLDCNATVTGAGPGVYVDGAVKKNFCGTAPLPLFSYPVGQTDHTPVDVTVTTLTTDPSSLTITAFDATLGGFNGSESLSRNWGITETGNLTATLSFHYLDGDVNGTESNYRVYKREGAGPAVDMCGGPCVDTVNNIIGPVAGVSVFSRWTGAGPLAPTAAGVTLGGRVVTADGRGIRNAIVTVSGNNLPARLNAITGPFGYYQFENLEVGETYVVTVGTKRYMFQQPSRVVSLTDNIADIDFIADPLP